MNSILQYVDPNKRLDSIFGDAKKIANEHGQRVASIALPFLSLHSKGQIIVAIGMGSYQIGTHALSIKEHYTKREWRAMGADAGKIALVASSIAFTIIFPMVQFAVSNAYTIACRSGMLVIHVYRREWKEGAKDVAALIHCAVHVASVWYGTAGWIALSVISQVGLELYSSYDEYANKKHWPEALASAALAAIRVYKAKPQLETAYRNHFGIQMTQDLWAEVVSEAKYQSRNEEADIEAVLVQRGISSHISNLEIYFTGYSYARGIIFKNLYFSNCNFSMSLFRKAIFSKVTMDSCLFERTLWIDSVVQDSRFYNCNFNNAAFLGSLLERVTIIQSDLTQSCWNDSTLKKISIIDCKLFEASFLNAQTSGSLLKDCDLTDCLLLDAKSGFSIKGGKPNVISRPIVAQLWNFRTQRRFSCYINQALSATGVIPLRFEMEPEDIDERRLCKEVQNVIAEIKQNPPSSMRSIPIEIMNRAVPGSEVWKLKTKAEMALRHSHGLTLPGGDDIEPELYGKINYRNDDSPDYRRSMMEIAALAAAEKMGTPTMGTCRGSQIINVYFGGTLFQHVPGHAVGKQACHLVDSSKKEIFQAILGDRFVSYSMHHQGADRIGENLEIVFENNSIPKVMISKNNQFIASQVHPETFVPLTKMEEGDFTIDQWGYADWMLAMMQNRYLYQYFLSQVYQFRYNSQSRST